MGFDDDDFFAGGGANGGFGNHDAFGYNDMEEQQQQPRAQARPSRQRRASLSVMNGPVMSLSTPISKPMRMKSSDNLGGEPRSGGRRQPAASEGPTSNLNRRLESAPLKASSSGSSRGDRSVASTASSNSQRRAGARRASMAGGVPLSSRSVESQPPSQSRQQYRHEEADYGYGDEQQYDDMGYGDNDIIQEEQEYHHPVAQQEEPVRARRQRRCSIADVVNTASVQPTPTDYGYGTTESYPSAEEARPRVGAAPSSLNQSIANMAIPMTLSDEPKRTNRRGSIAMLGNIGRSSKPSKEPEPVASKKAAADRDRQRQRQGTLLDRVGAGTNNDGRGSSRAGTTSYSDRILSK